MNAHRYSQALIALAAATFILVVAANIAIDAQGVFGVSANAANRNTRYFSFNGYEKAAAVTDGLLFGSSRGNGIDPADLAEYLPASRFAAFAVEAGLITDHLPVLEYALRRQAEDARRLRAIFLLLDADLFGTTPFTNQRIGTQLAPELTGEPRLRFWWRYLTAIQFAAWRNELAARRGARVAVPAAHGRGRGG
ncbi:MAG: hypothetical protein HY056_06200 [Proteobacteria bacterium]|nr:hypothetical protein [Pseudomonadota bacterium]